MKQLFVPKYALSMGVPSLDAFRAQNKNKINKTTANNSKNNNNKNKNNTNCNQASGV
jgi:hypothetical protein